MESFKLYESITRYLKIKLLFLFVLSGRIVLNHMILNKTNYIVVTCCMLISYDQTNNNIIYKQLIFYRIAGYLIMHIMTFMPIYYICN